MRRKEREQKREEVGLGEQEKVVCLQIEKSCLAQTILLSSKLFTLLCLSDLIYMEPYSDT